MNSDSENQLLLAARDGCRTALNQLLDVHRNRLRRTVNIRLDPRVRGRVDDSDILQNSLMEASRRLPEYLIGQNEMPFYLWLRCITVDQILMCHRRHLSAAKRDVKREVSIEEIPLPVAPRSFATALILDSHSPEQKAIDAEILREVERALEELSENDREILVLRHFEQLNNQEAAGVLSINESAASSRYLRALERARRALKIIQNQKSP